MIVTAAVFLGFVLLRWVLVFGGVMLLIPRVRQCPACFQATLRIRRPWLRRLLPRLEWRWCPSCGWKGPSSRTESELVASPAEGRRAVEEASRLRSGNTEAPLDDSSERER